MSKLYDKFWVRVAILLSVVVVVVGFPVFHREKGFPASVLWTLLVVLGVWLTYIVRACLWGDCRDKGHSSPKVSDGV